MESKRTLGLKKDSLGELTTEQMSAIVGGSIVETICVTTVNVRTLEAPCERPSCCSCTAISDTVER